MERTEQKGALLDESSVLDGKYEILRVIGAGAMGVVYEAVHLGINRRVAIKVLNEDTAQQEHGTERFRREAVITGALGHENIVDVTDVGKTTSGTPYIVMEYLEGRSLHDVLQDEGTLPIIEAVSILIHVLDALAVVHEADVIHRDLKPENVFLAERRRAFNSTKTVVKVLDFGICKPHDSEMMATTLTDSGIVIGTPYYMAPEQMVGSGVDRQSDVYAAGLILYQALTGRLPFDGRTIGEFFAVVLSESPPSPRTFRPDIPPDLETVMLRAIAREKEDRYSSAEELLRALAPYGPEGLVSSLLDARAGRRRALAAEKNRISKLFGRKASSQRRLIALLGSGLVVLLVAVVLLGFDFVGGDEAPPIERGSPVAPAFSRTEPEDDVNDLEPAAEVPSASTAPAPVVDESRVPPTVEVREAVSGEGSDREVADRSERPAPREVRPRPVVRDAAARGPVASPSAPEGAGQEQGSAAEPIDVDYPTGPSGSATERREPPVPVTESIDDEYPE